MTRWTLRFGFVLLCAALLAGPANAEFSKLNARARIAIAQLESGASAKALMAEGAAVNEEGEIDVFVVGDVSRAELEAAGARVRTELPGLFTAYIPLSAVDKVVALAGVKRIEGGAPCELELDASVPTTGANLLRGVGPGFPGLNGAGILVGDVDSGVDYGHDDFKDAGGLTRFVNIWDQTAPAGPAPAGFPYGTEWNAAQIDANVATEVDVSGHGTHVIGIAAGDGSGTGGATPPFTFVGMAPKADLIMVKTSNITSQVLDGVAYVFARATALGKLSVCNLSLGSHYGPHDGSSAFESGLTALTGPGRIVIKSAGNERGVAQHSEVFATGAGTNTTLSVTGSATGRTIAFAGYYNATETVDVTMTSPNGTVIGPIALGNANAAYPGTATANGRVYLENGLTVYPSGGREVYCEITVQAGQNMNGVWTIKYTATGLGAANGEVDTWRFFQSTGSAANFVAGNQNNEELISEPGNSAGVITTAAYWTKRNWIDCAGASVGFTTAPPIGTLASFSSPGPTRDGRQKPDIAAPGAGVASATSFDIAQVCASPSLNLNDAMMHTINTGTSMAAPHVTGATALILQKYGAVAPAFVKTFLNGRAIIDGNTGAPWNKDWGNGKLFLGDMVDPTVAVTSPNGGEILQVSTSANLTWNATDALGGVTSVNLDLSRTGAGGPWESIATGQPNSGSYAWNVNGPGTTQAILRVTASDAAGNSGSDVSDAVWTIETPVPVIAPMVNVVAKPGANRVEWRFGAPDYSVVRVERADSENGAYERIEAEIGSEGVTSYAIDRSAQAGIDYWYKLIALHAGNEVAFGPFEARAKALSFALSRIAPNPSTQGPVRVEFALPHDAKIRVSVVDVRGREVVELANARYTTGVHAVTWNRESKTGRVAAGLYFVRYSTPEGDRFERLVCTN